MMQIDADVLQKFSKIHMKTPVLEPLFKRIALNFIKKRLQHRCFHVSIVKVLKAAFLRDTSRRLLLLRERTLSM